MAETASGTLSSSRPDCSAIRNRTRLLDRSTLAESLAVFIAGAALMHFFYAGTGGVLGDELGVPGHDSFYHTRMASLLPEHGLLRRMPWLRFCYFTDEGDTFVSHHYGFHVYLAPFVRLSEWLSGNTVAGGRWAITTTFAVTLLLFHLLLVAEGLRWRWMWLFLFLLLPFQFFTRHAYVRAINPSLVMMLLITLLMFRGRVIAAGLAVLVYTHLYLGGVIFAPLLVILFVVATIAAPREERCFPWKLVVSTLAGWIVGIAIHPYRGGMIEFLRLQVFGSGLSPDIPVGREWKPYEGVWWFAQMIAVLLSVWAVAVAARLRSGVKVNTPTLMLLLAHFVFLALTFKARRFIEYWPMFCLLSAAYLSAPMAAHLHERMLGTWERDGTRRLGLARSLAYWLPALALVAGAFRLGRLESAEPFIAYWPTWVGVAAAYLVATLAIPRWKPLHAAEANRHIPPRLALAVPTAIAVLAAAVCAASHPLSQVQRSVRCGYDLPAIRGAMNYLKGHSQPGDVVFTDDWDVFPVFFHFNTHNHYIVGLDPKFTHARRPDLWERYVKITRGQVPAETFIDMPGEDGKPTREAIHIELADIRRYFGASFVVTDRDHKPLAAKLAKAPELAELVYPSTAYRASRDEPYLVFRILPEDAAISREEQTPHVATASVIYLSEVQALRVSQGWGDFVADRSVGGGPIRLGNKVYAKGLGTHAPSTLEYEIPDGFAYFEAAAGIDANTNGLGSVRVSVEVDGEVRFQSDVLTGVAEPVVVRLPLPGATRLTLRADPTPDGKKHDHVDWADARFTR